MSRWFRGAAAQAPMNAEEEDQYLRDVEHALLKLLNDDIEEADRILKQQDSSYHHLGRGISSFIASMLGVEKELLREAATVLQDAENKTWADMKKAQREPTAFQSAIYPPGTEYQLCYAISQLTSAICAILSGSIIEAIKGFRKLRQAYLTLDGIMQIEARYLKHRITPGKKSLDSTKISLVSSHRKPGPTAPVPLGNGSLSKPNPEGPFDEKSSAELADHPRQSIGSVGSGMLHLEIDNDGELSPVVTRQDSKLLDVDPASVGITNHTDIFIHSGTRLCYGVLLVVFSMVENPIFNKILYIVGFKGDRERGTRYLWQATRFNNLNSAIAGIALLGYYNGLVGFCEILPTDADADNDLAGYPRAKCMTLLTEMRKRYPESRFWKMEEARMHSYNRNLSAAVKILAENSNSNMKQIATINMFEMALASMFLHDYELCARSWIQCSELSQWSPALYAYLTGVAYLELYRNTRKTDHKAAKKHREKAKSYIKKGPPLAGRQKVMARDLPFDLYIVRKVKKWEERSKAWNVDIIDAIGVSPLAEMIHFWGGPKKQNPEELRKSMELLDWARTENPDRFKDNLDETAIQAVLKASFLRNLGSLDEASEILKTQVLNHERHEFKGPLKDYWTLPSAHYEMACLAWAEKDLAGQDHHARVLDCEQWLQKCRGWEAFVLDSRMSVRVSTSLLTVKRHRKIMGI